MYSVIVVAALSVGVSAPDCHYAKGCYGCGGCYGCAGCYGCGGCWGGACYGCGGGYAYGSCYGSPYNSCYGCGGCQGCYGNCYGVMSVTGSWTCHGCYGVGCYGGGCYGAGGVIFSGASPVYAPNTPLAPTVPVFSNTVEPKESKDKVTAPAKAKVVVEVPSGAKLYIDDQPSKSTSEKRVFSTPVLEVGQSYYYILRAEIEKDGKTYSDTKRLVVRAGAEVSASFVEADFKISPTATASAMNK